MKLEQKKLDGGTVVIELEGEADLAAAPEFQETVREVLKEEPPLLIIDFSKATFVNTPVWAVIVEYYQYATRKNLNLAVTGLQGRVQASFDIVRLGEFIHHFPTIDEAVKELSFRGKFSKANPEAEQQ